MAVFNEILKIHSLFKNIKIIIDFIQDIRKLSRKYILQNLLY